MKEIRRQLASLLDWSEAHVSFDAAVKGLPVAARGKVPKGLPYSAWQLVEHMRLAQADILEFCIRPQYTEKRWPQDYWPSSPMPPTARAWSASLAQIRKDRAALIKLATDPRVELLAKVPAGTGQTVLREILLVADHTAYHVGELVAVRRLLGHWARG